MFPEHLENQLSPTEHRLLAVYRARGGRGVVLWVTIMSIAASVLLTLMAVLLVRGNLFADPETLVVALTLAVLVPAFVAPVASYCIVSLLVRLDEALSLAVALSTIDPLTGSANRRGFFTNAESSVRALNQTEQCVVGMVDLDRFKELNDSYGHQAGDAALVLMATSLAEAVGNRGTVGRVGGDEFAFFYLAGSGEAEAFRETLIDRCSALEWNDAAGRRLSVRASIGFVQLRSAETFDEALARADAEVYRVKAQRAGARSGSTDSVSRTRFRGASANDDAEGAMSAALPHPPGARY